MKNRYKALLEENLTQPGRRETEIDGVAIFRRDYPYEKKPLIYKPQVIILAQGKKNVYLGEKRYTYDTENYFVLTVPLPVICEAHIEPDKPMLGMVLEINPQIIGEILYDMESPPPSRTSLTISIYQATLSDSILDPAIRLMESLKSKNEARVLGPVYLKEIMYKILTGENGEILRELAYNNRNIYQISRVISRIHEDISRPLEVQSLAQEAGMSPSAFHSNFKAVTSTSPLQYIKNVRLHKAKELIQQEGEKVYEAAMSVGYESSSQFNREYKRFFGVTPAKDRPDIVAI